MAIPDPEAGECDGQDEREWSTLSRLVRHTLQPRGQEWPSSSLLCWTVYHRFRWFFRCRHILSLVAWPPRLAKGTRLASDRRLHTPEPQAGCQMSYHWMVIPHFRVGLKLSGKVRHLKTKGFVQDDEDVRKLVKTP